MNPIHPTLVVALGLAASILSACSAESTPMNGTAAGGPSDRPNVLFLVVDDLRCELGFYGAEHAITPNLDALAARGMVFDRAYAQVAVCNPSRVSMLTGLRPDTTGVFTLEQPFRRYAPRAVTLPQHFAANGWHSVGIGKIHHQPFPDPASWSERKWLAGAGNPNAEDPALRETREFWLWSEAQRAELMAWKRQARALGRPAVYVDRRRPPATNDEEVEDEQRYAGAMVHTVLGRLPELAAREEPFFLAVGFVLPHLPFTAPKRYWDLYDRGALPQAAHPALPEGAPRMALNSMYELRDYLDFAALGDGLGDVGAVGVIVEMDEYYADQLGPGGRRVATQVARQLAEPRPDDLSKVDLVSYRRLNRRWHDWQTVVDVCRRIAVKVLDRLAEDSL